MSTEAAVIRANDHEGGGRLLTLTRPPANALDESLLMALGEALNAAQADPGVRAVVLTGDGRFFSGGFDLAAPRRDAAAARQMRILYRALHAELLGFPKPTLAMVNGHAIAGGFVLALACDYRLGIEGDYRVGLNEVAVGAGFPRTAVEIVRLRLPHARASELMLGAALYPASQAVRLGLVDELVAAVGFGHVATAQVVGKLVAPASVGAPAAEPPRPRSEQLVFLSTLHGKPFTAAEFGNWFADRCSVAGAPGRAHELRKASAIRHALNCVTAPELMARHGWKTIRRSATIHRGGNSHPARGECWREDHFRYRRWLTF